MRLCFQYHIRRGLCVAVCYTCNSGKVQFLKTWGNTLGRKVPWQSILSVRWYIEYNFSHAYGVFFNVSSMNQTR
ncbi:hypothetical protein ANAPRD1_01129 [Anaplasma phagocytophilum]|nr:hypothetical protein ANAPRD1_01129 [Anaplasma phagocytophilum]